MVPFAVPFNHIRRLKHLRNTSLQQWFTEGNAQGETRTPTNLSSTDFKSYVFYLYALKYTIPPRINTIEI